MTTQDYETFKLGDWKLQCGEEIPDAHIAYKTFGDSKSPAIVYPTWYSGCRYQSLIVLDATQNRLHRFEKSCSQISSFQ